MTQSMVNFRMDSDLKQEMEAVCRELGLSVTTAFTVFARKMTRERRIPFDVSIDPFYSEANQRVLMSRIAEIESGKAKLVEHAPIEDAA